MCIRDRMSTRGGKNEKPTFVCFFRSGKPIKTTRYRVCLERPIEQGGRSVDPSCGPPCVKGGPSLRRLLEINSAVGRWLHLSSLLLSCAYFVAMSSMRRLALMFSATTASVFTHLGEYAFRQVIIYEVSRSVHEGVGYIRGRVVPMVITAAASCSIQPFCMFGKRVAHQRCYAGTVPLLYLIHVVFCTCGRNIDYRRRQ